MTTGNLRTFGETVFQKMLGAGEPDSGAKANVFATICAGFLAGAVVGGVCTNVMGNRALWVVDGLLLAIWFRLFAAYRQ